MSDNNNPYRIGAKVFRVYWDLQEGDWAVKKVTISEVKPYLDSHIYKVGPNVWTYKASLFASTFDARRNVVFRRSQKHTVREFDF